MAINTLEKIDQFNKNCTTGDPCGNACIQQGLRCEIELGPELKQRANRARQALKSLPGLGAAKSFRDTMRSVFQFSRQKMPSKEKALQIAAVIGAVGLAAHSKIRERYNQGTQNAAEAVKIQSQGITAPDLSNRSQITFTVDGVSYGDSFAPGEAIAGELRKEKFFESHQLEPIANEQRAAVIEGYENMSPAEKLVARSIDQSRRFMQNVAVRGNDPLASEMASKMLAYSRDDRGRNLPMNVVSYGSGGHVTAEAMDIVNRIDPSLASRIRVINMQTPDLQLNEKHGQVRSLTNRFHPMQIVPMKNKVVIDGPDDGTGRNFTSNPNTMRFLKGVMKGGATGDVRTTGSNRGGATPAPVRTFMQQSSGIRRPAPTTHSSGIVRSTSLGTTSDEQAADAFAREQAKRERIATAQQVGASKPSKAPRSMGIDLSNENLFSLEAAKAKFPDASQAELEQAVKISKLPPLVLLAVSRGEIKANDGQLQDIGQSIRDKEFNNDRSALEAWISKIAGDAGKQRSEVTLSDIQIAKKRWLSNDRKRPGAERTDASRMANPSKEAINIMKLLSWIGSEKDDEIAIALGIGGEEFSTDTQKAAIKRKRREVQRMLVDNFGSCHISILQADEFFRRMFPSLFEPRFFNGERY